MSDRLFRIRRKMAKKRDPKVGTGKNQKVLVGAYTQMRTQKTQLVSNLPQKQTQELRLQKLKESVNLLRERYRYLQLVSKEQR